MSMGEVRGASGASRLLCGGGEGVKDLRDGVGRPIERLPRRVEWVAIAEVCGGRVETAQAAQAERRDNCVATVLATKIVVREAATRCGRARA